MTRVAILGGGVGGLSAAHELSERRGFEVTVYEAKPAFGGKARSMPVPGSGVGGRDHLPGEHGFRFFPGFYEHVTDTMKRIPYGDGNVFGNLDECTKVLLAQDGGRDEIFGPTGVPRTLDEVVDALRTVKTILFDVGIKTSEFVTFVEQIVQFMMACDARRNAWDDTSWLKYVKADGSDGEKTEAYMKFLAAGMTRTLVAAKAEKMSARTGGTILCQLVYDSLGLDGHLDNVLKGPTSEVWIDPWITLLESRGVNLRPNCAVAGILCDDTRITSVTIARTDDGGTESIDADYYIAAMPVERFKEFVSPAVLRLDPSLAGVHALETDWMTGVMYYFDEDVPLVHGHAVFIDSDWSLSAISQKQFWPTVDLEQRGDGRVEGILSVDVSAWDVPGSTGKNAKSSTREEIFDEVWKQLTDHIDDGTLAAKNVIARFLDPAIDFQNGVANNAEPLLINTVGSAKYRPEAVTRIPNLFLASDFVATNTDLATMEGANEAARAAVNGILAASGSPHKPCEIWKLKEPWIFWPFRQLDRLRWKFGRKPAKVPIRVTDDGEIEPTSPILKLMLARLNKSSNPTFLKKN